MKLRNKAAKGGSSPASCCASFVRMFKPQFAPMVEAGTKLQTVRPTPKRLPKAGDKISLRTWTDKPYRSKQRVLMETTISDVRTFELRADYSMHVDGRELTSAERAAFALADGFGSPTELYNWFEAAHGLPFVGVVIHWHNIKAEPTPAGPASRTQDNQTK